MIPQLLLIYLCIRSSFAGYVSVQLPYANPAGINYVSGQGHYQAGLLAGPARYHYPYSVQQAGAIPAQVQGFQVVGSPSFYSYNLPGSVSVAQHPFQTYGHAAVTPVVYGTAVQRPTVVAVAPQPIAPQPLAPQPVHPVVTQYHTPAVQPVHVPTAAAVPVHVPVATVTPVTPIAPIATVTPVTTTVTKTVTREESSISSSTEAPLPVIKSRRYKVRRPAIQNQFYDIEERVIIRPVGSALVELEQPASRTETKVTTHTIQTQASNGGRNGGAVGGRTFNTGTTIVTQKPQVIQTHTVYQTPVQQTHTVYQQTPAPRINTVYQQTPVQETHTVYQQTPEPRINTVYQQTPVQQTHTVYQQTPAPRISTVYQQTPVQQTHTVYQQTPVQQTKTVYHQTPVQQTDIVYQQTPAPRINTVYTPVQQTHTVIQQTPAPRINTVYHQQPVQQTNTVYHQTPVQQTHTVIQQTPAPRINTVYQQTPVQQTNTVYHQVPVQRTHTVYHQTPVQQTPVLAPHPVVIHASSAGHVVPHVQAPVYVNHVQPVYVPTSAIPVTTTVTTVKPPHHVTFPVVTTEAPTTIISSTTSSTDGDDYDDTVVVEARNGGRTIYPAASTEAPLKYSNPVATTKLKSVDDAQSVDALPQRGDIAISYAASEATHQSLSSNEETVTESPTTTKPQLSVSASYKNVQINSRINTEDRNQTQALVAEDHQQSQTRKAAFSETSVTSPRVVISSGLSAEQARNNQEQFIRLLSERDSIAEVSYGPNTDTSSSLINTYVRSRVLSATPAPAGATESSRTVNIRRIIVSRPIETEQEVEVREQTFPTYTTQHHQITSSSEQIPVYTTAKPPAFAHDDVQ